MAKFVVTWREQDEEKEYGTGGLLRACSIAEYPGDLAAATEYFTRRIYFGGDETGTFGDYKVNENDHDVRVFPFEAGIDGGIEAMRAEHKRLDSEERARLAADKERAEYERLKAKFEGAS